MSLFSLFTSVWLTAQSPVVIDADFLRLKQSLAVHGFAVRLEEPPVRGTYGLLQVQTREIWIHPLVFELGIARPTLIHEATHAAQLCAGQGKMQALGLSLSPPNESRPFFMYYKDGTRRHLEAEAYGVQTHPDGLNLVISLLERECQGQW